MWLHCQFEAADLVFACMLCVFVGLWVCSCVCVCKCVQSVVHEDREPWHIGEPVCVFFIVVYSPKAIFKSNKNIANTNMFIGLELLPFLRRNDTIRMDRRICTGSTTLPTRWGGQVKLFRFCCLEKSARILCAFSCQRCWHTLARTLLGFTIHVQKLTQATCTQSVSIFEQVQRAQL